MNSVTEIGLILLLTVLNGVFSMSEAAVISARKARLLQLTEEGDARAGIALDLAEKPDRFLSTVQIGITLIGILSGAYGGAGLSAKLAGALHTAGLSEKMSRDIGFGVVVLAITYLSLIIGELVPKTLALNNPEGIAARIARPMRGLSVIASPVVWLLSISTSGLLRLMGVKPSAEPPVTEEEVKILIKQGTLAGVFEAQEQEILERVFRLGDRRTVNLMTPRREVIWLDVEDTPEETRQKIVDAHHTVFPVCEGSLDQLLGVVSLKALWEQSARERSIDLKALMSPPLYVLESVKALHLLEEFKRAGQHIAFVIDEYGVVGGLVTIHDVLEGMVGDVSTNQEPEDRSAVQREDGSWLLDGTLAVDEFRHLLHIRDLPESEAGDYETLGGFVMRRLGKIPAVSDHFTWQNLRFEVVDMDQHRVDKVLVSPADPPAPNKA